MKLNSIQYQNWGCNEIWITRPVRDSSAHQSMVHFAIKSSWKQSEKSPNRKNAHIKQEQSMEEQKISDEENDTLESQELRL